MTTRQTAKNRTSMGRAKPPRRAQRVTEATTKLVRPAPAVSAWTGARAMGGAKPTTIDQFLARLPEPERRALASLRRAIRAAAPTAEEALSYGVPAFRWQGRLLVAFGAARKHCSFFPGALAVAKHQVDLAGYATSKGTVRFPASRPLPAALVRKLVRTRMSQSADRGSTKRAESVDERSFWRPIPSSIR